MDQRSSNHFAMASLKNKAARLHNNVPLVRRIPLRAVAIILLLVLINLIVWAAVGVVLSYHEALTGTAVLAWTLGLRHGLDSDHICAIDLMTRRLVAVGQRPVTVGTWFSLGHSTIVVITCIVVAATSSAISKRFDSFSYIGGIVGSSVSAAFLIILGLANLWILVVLVRQMKKLLTTEDAAERQQFEIKGGGCLFRVLSKAFNLVDRPWRMYPIGVLFGLGFDTSSEVALLGIASIKAGTGTSFWLIMIFPILFTAGMCMVDTIDGALMMSLYTSASGARDPIVVLYYNIILTTLTCFVAGFVGTLQVLGLGLAILGDDADKYRFWRGVEKLEDRYDVIGGVICGLFIIIGITSVLTYKPWLAWVDKDGLLEHRDLDAHEELVPEPGTLSFGPKPDSETFSDDRDTQPQKSSAMVVESDMGHFLGSSSQHVRNG